MPVVVAVLGIVGIISGQLINAWREDRRWKRELEREDLRWRREREREQERNEIERAREELRQAHDARIEWRSQRFEVYRNFVTSVDELVYLLPPEGDQDLPYDIMTCFKDPNFSSELSVRLSAVREAAVAIELLAGGRLVSTADNLVSECGAVRYSLYIPPRPPPRKDSDEGEEKVDWGRMAARFLPALKRLKAVRAQFISEVKRELALVTPEDAKGKS
ncbi:hypothetical protein [Lentzea waywayandensis]|uniref:hypothetical protein n=1 Tax=Lentzea waywayandensis TaxID=84724 RepID=UPI00116086BD|nr:hypothetical protein [Lentzea waywayandensis]